MGHSLTRRSYMPGASCSVNLDCNPKCFELGGYSEDLSARSGKRWDGFLGLNVIFRTLWLR